MTVVLGAYFVLTGSAAGFLGIRYGVADLAASLWVPWNGVLATLYAVDLVVILLLVAFARFRRMEIA